MQHFHGMTVEWLGHGTFLWKTAKGTTILIDPWLESNPAHPKNWRAPEKIDFVLCTHGHMDHIGDAAAVATKYKPKFVGIFELVNYLQFKGAESVIPMNIGGTVALGDVSVTLVEARHSSSIEDNGQVIYCGEPSGFIIRAEGEPVIYHAGDTSIFSDMKLIGHLYHPDVACLPIGDHFTMGPDTAALAAEFVGCTKVIPMHYGTFPALTGTPEQLRKYLKGKPIEVVEMTPGQALS
jgi:L-ascorbate metabolism protein UlaG (beta-lactamase superfamily)